MTPAHYSAGKHALHPLHFECRLFCFSAFHWWDSQSCFELLPISLDVQQHAHNFTMMAPDNDQQWALACRNTLTHRHTHKNHHEHSALDPISARMCCTAIMGITTQYQPMHNFSQWQTFLNCQNCRCVCVCVHNLAYLLLIITNRFETSNKQLHYGQGSRSLDMRTTVVASEQCIIVLLHHCVTTISDPLVEFEHYITAADNRPSLSAQSMC